MNPKALELQARTQKFATAVIRFCERLPKDAATQKIVDQLLDSSASTDSNYRATCRARSVAAEEADESKGWLELLVAPIFEMNSSGPRQHRGCSRSDPGIS
jgi:four helix bundle protein